MPGNYIQFKTDALGDSVACYDVNGVLQYTLTIAAGGITMLDSASLAVAAILKDGSISGKHVCLIGDLYFGGNSIAANLILKQTGGGYPALMMPSDADDGVKIQVMSRQQPAIADAAGTLAQATTAINALLAAARTHGFIAT